MVNVWAIVIFFSICLIIVVFFSIMAWRKNRKSKMFSKSGSSSRNFDVEDGQWHTGIGSVGGKSKQHGKGWRWKRILQRVGWIQVTSAAEPYPERGMHSLREGSFVVDDESDEDASPLEAIAGVRPALKEFFEEINKRPKAPPVSIPEVEPFGRDSFEVYGYGTNNMSPLPIPTTTATTSTTTYTYPQCAIEVDGTSTGTCTPMQSPLANNIYHLNDIGRAFPLTSHNGFWTSSQDDMMGALPVPEDHTLCQHQPGYDQSSICQIPQPTVDRNLAAFQYEDPNLVPAPLNIRKGKNTRTASYSLAQQVRTSSPVKAQLITIGGSDGASSTRGRPRTRAVSAFVSSSPIKAESRYSHFESPLRQHPIAKEDEVESIKENQVPAVPLPGIDEQMKLAAFKFDIPMVPDRTRKRYTLVGSIPEKEIAKSPEVEMALPRSLQIGVQDANPSDQDLQQSRPSPNRNSSFHERARPATAPPQSPSHSRNHPPSLQIGRRPTDRASRCRQNRHYSVMDDTWMKVPLTPRGNTPHTPKRWTWTAEERKAAGLVELPE